MLTVSGLRKRFHRNAPVALDDVSFEVREGEIFGLLGHNGAGKSTALGILLGMVYPDAGEVMIGGRSVQREREAALRQVGAIFEAPAFYEYLSGWQNLKVLTAFSGGVPRETMLETVDWVGLGKRIHHKVGTYSHGMRQRLALAQALLPRPKVLILDEPTDGLDPEGIVEFREQIGQLRTEFGVTILLSSHLLSEVEQVCDRVAILKAGRKIYEGQCRGLERDLIYRVESPDSDRVRITLTAAGAADAGAENCYRLPKSMDAAEMLASLIMQGIRVVQYCRVEKRLEDRYLEIAKDGKPHE